MPVPKGGDGEVLPFPRLNDKQDNEAFWKQIAIKGMSRWAICFGVLGAVGYAGSVLLTRGGVV